MEIVTSHDGIKAILELDQQETLWWRKRIGEIRAQHVKKPKDLVNDYVTSIQDNPEFADHLRNTSSFIQELRKNTWEEYVESELAFYRSIINVLMQERDHSKEVLGTLLNDDVTKALASAKNKHETIAIISDLFGNFAGRIFPYFYELSKSVTQSRRSRAGTEFEATISNIMRHYEYPYSTQSELGQRIFDTKGLGKKVDGVVPGMEAYSVNRSKCMVTTMKTTIRERWQEVVEELNRTNIPSIYLLTLDEGITENTLSLMSNHNITLVTYDTIKEKYPTFTNIISFETLFNEEIPHCLEWWQRNHPDMCS